MPNLRRASSAIAETIRTLAEPRVRTAFDFYGAGASFPHAAEGQPDLNVLASLGLCSNLGWQDADNLRHVALNGVEL